MSPSAASTRSRTSSKIVGGGHKLEAPRSRSVRYRVNYKAFIYVGQASGASKYSRTCIAIYGYNPVAMVMKSVDPASGFAGGKPKVTRTGQSAGHHRGSELLHVRVPASRRSKPVGTRAISGEPSHLQARWREDGPFWITGEFDPTLHYS